MNALPNYMTVASNIKKWLHEYLEQSSYDGFVIALSGGLDSSVAAVLCRQVTSASLGLLLPCGETPSDATTDAQQLAHQFKIKTITYDLTPAYNALRQIFSVLSENAATIPLANIKARLRMVALYFTANSQRRLVVGTGNRTELALGYFTKYGDGGVDILPLGNLLKHEVRDLARHLGIPDQIITKPPSAGLWPGQTDEGELGATYDQLDDLVMGKTPIGLSSDQLEQLQQRMMASQHKRNLPPICPL